MNIKWTLLWGKTCCQVSGFGDLVTSDLEPIHAETVVLVVVYSIHTRVKEIHPHIIIKNVSATKVHSQTKECFKVSTMDDVTHTYVQASEH